MNIKHIILFTVFMLAAGKASANDGVYFTSGSLLVPIHETDIAVKKEILTISLCDDGMAHVTVDYEFMNNGTEKTVEMGFEAAPPYNSGDELNRNGGHPHIKDFTVVMNGKTLTYNNMLSVSGKLDTPYTGTGFTEDGAFPDNYSYVYRFKAPFKHGINTVRHTYQYRMSTGVGRTFEVPYWLTPAKRWANRQIDDFTLRISAPNTAKHFMLADSLFTGSEFRTVEGKGKIRHRKVWDGSYVEVALRNGTVEWHGTNFKPEDDIDIVSADMYINLNEDNPLGTFYDRSENYVIWPMGMNVNKRIARNLPYANRGYVFKDAALKKYFSQFWWYMPDPSYQPSQKDFTPRELRLVNRGE